jgi:hypothetical protein
VVVDSLAEWPALRWKLTAPETYVLYSVGEGFGAEAFKLAVKELVARRALRVEPVETRGWHGLRTIRSALVEGPVRLAPEPSLAPVLELFARARKRTFQAGAGSAAGMRPVEGVLTQDFAKAGRKQFRHFHKYQSGHVVPALEARGLLTTREHLVLGFLRSTPTWTARGSEAVDELERWLQVGKQRFRGWVSADPAKALAYTSGAGAAILLLDDLYPDFGRLGQHLAERPLAGGMVGHGSAAEFGDADDASAGSSLDLPDADVGADPGAAEVDLGGLDLGALESSVSGFEGLAAAFSAIDIGIVAGGGGGGGGGDGGGG